jgi:hypothetical protein
MDPDTPTRRVLCLGSSTVAFPEDEPETSFPAFLKRDLAHLAPTLTWEVTNAVAYAYANMPQRCTDLVGRYNPDFIFFTCSAIYADDSVLNSIQQRWPRLHGPASKVLKRIEGPGGAPAYGGSSVGARVARLARGAARLTVGMAPLVSLEVATKATIESLRAITGPNRFVICRLTVGAERDTSQYSESRRRIEAFNSAVSAECEDLGVTYFDMKREVHRAGMEYTYAPDGIHGDLSVREFSATLVARRMVELAGMKSEADRPVQTAEG